MVKKNICLTLYLFIDESAVIFLNQNMSKNL